LPGKGLYLVKVDYPEKGMVYDQDNAPDL